MALRGEGCVHAQLLHPKSHCLAAECLCLCIRTLKIMPPSRTPLFPYRDTLNNFFIDGRSTTNGGRVATPSLNFFFLVQQRKNSVFSRRVCTATLLIITQAQISVTLGSQTINQAIFMHDGQRTKLVQVL